MTSNCSNRSNLTVFGYVREIETHYKFTTDIPSTINTLILQFYPKEYLLFGIGYASKEQFGLKQEYEEKNNLKQYDPNITKQKWHFLSTMSSLCFSPYLVSCGERSFCIATINNKVYCAGNNELNECGISAVKHGDQIEKYTKIKIEHKLDGDHILDIMSNGTSTTHKFVVFKNIQYDQQIFYGFGSNVFDQQGLNYNSSKVSSPTMIDPLNSLFKHTKIIAISCGSAHSLFLAQNGRVFGCGSNEYGQLGIKVNTDNQIIKPQIIPFLYFITKISSGQHHNLCVDKDGKLWVFGRNNKYQLGLGIPYGYDDYSEYIDTPILNPLFDASIDCIKIVFIDCGYIFSLCIAETGVVYMFGSNRYGQIGDAKCGGSVYHPYCIQSSQKMQDIKFKFGACSYNHTALISYSPKNNLYLFGCNDLNQSGNNAKDSTYTQIEPYLVKKNEIGISENTQIDYVIVDYGVTVVVCEK